MRRELPAFRLLSFLCEVVLIRATHDSPGERNDMLAANGPSVVAPKAEVSSVRLPLDDVTPSFRSGCMS